MDNQQSPIHQAYLDIDVVQGAIQIDISIDAKVARMKDTTSNDLETLALCIFTNPSTWAGYDTRSIFKRSLTGLNSEFSFP